MEARIRVFLSHNMSWELDLLKHWQEKATYPIEITTGSNNIPLIQQITHNKPNIIILLVRGVKNIQKEVEEIQHKISDVYIMLVSNEKSIEFLQWAVNHHVFAYLDEATDFLIWEPYFYEIRDKIVKRDKEREQIEKYKKSKLKLQLKDLQNIFERILQTPEEVGVLINEINRRYHLRLKKKGFRVCILQLNRMDLFSERSDFAIELYKLCKKYSSKNAEILQMQKFQYGFLILLNDNCKLEKESMLPFVQTIYQAIENLKRKYGEFKVAIGISDYADEMKATKALVQQAYYVVQFKYITHEGIYYFEDLEVKQNAYSKVLQEEQKRNLIRICQKLDANEWQEWLQNLHQYTEEKYEKNPIYYIYLKNEIIDTMNQVWVNTESNDFFEEEQSHLDSLDFVFSKQEMFQKFSEIISVMFQKRVVAGHKKACEPIEKTMHYLKENLSKPITLEEIASMVNLTPSYFSTLFKDQTGMTYIEYLTEVRLSYAKELLQSQKYLIKDVSKMAGYVDEKYFRKLFKGRFGVLPSYFYKK